MQTKVIGPHELSLAVTELHNGQPVVFPTETVYGLGAPLFCTAAIEKVFAIKQRPTDNPLIAHIASIEQAQSIGFLPELFYALANVFWPGPLTIVVPKKDCVPDISSAGHPTIAIRMPAHEIAQSLIEQFGEPLVAPSANLSGKPSPTSLNDVLEDLEGKIAIAIDGGKCAIGIESTVVSLVGPKPILLRPGVITKMDLEQVLGQSIDLPTKQTPHLSPGMKYRHYAPKAKVHLVYDSHTPSIRINAQTLYAELRKADRLGLSEICIYCDEATKQNPALMNRLVLASGSST